MPGDVIFVREERPYTAQLQDALRAIHDSQLVAAHQFLPGLLVVHTVGPALSPGIGCVVKINRFLAQGLGNLLQRTAFLSSQKKKSIAVAYDGLGCILIDRLQLALGLQNDRSGDFPASDRRDQLVKLRDLPE